MRQPVPKPGDRVAVVVPTSEPLLRTIVAAWFCRAALVVLPHRLGGARSTANVEKLSRMLAEAGKCVARAPAGREPAAGYGEDLGR